MSRDRNPSNRKNWIMACRACGLPFADDLTMDVVHQHWRAEHPQGGPDVQLDLRWVGRGPAPRVKPRWN